MPPMASKYLVDDRCGKLLSIFLNAILPIFTTGYSYVFILTQFKLTNIEIL